MNGSSATLSMYLASWRADSLRPPLPNAREQARAAMLAALTSPRDSRRTRALSFLLPFRPRFRHTMLGASALALAGAVVVAVLGWNAPAGSALYGVRAARQGIQLVLPGANQAALHLQYAEAFLADAQKGVNLSASLSGATNELDAAHTDLPADHTSPLWARWSSDEAELSTDETQSRESEGSAGAAPGAARPAHNDSEGNPAAAGPTHSSDEAGNPSAQPSERPGTYPSGSGDGEGGGGGSTAQAWPSGSPGGDR
jgi:hypothetical protein